MAGGLATGWAIKLLPLLLLSALPAVAQAQYSYTTNEGAATITGYTGPGGSVAIPGAIDGLPVTSIGEFAFLGCEGLAAVTIPSGVTNIGDQAFYECTNLVSVTMSSGVATIGFEAFAGCSSLTNVALPGSVASIMGGAFRQCGSLAGITIPSSVTAIEAEAFEYCTSLAAITVEALNSVYCSVNGVLFDKDQTQLLQYPPGRAASGYTIPDRVAVIAPAAFFGCSKLIGISMTSTVGSIGSEAFADCTSLTAIKVNALSPNYCSVDGVLFNKSQTTLIAFPGGRIGSYTAPVGVTSIGGAAFEFCTGLTSVIIPGSVTSIGEQAFYGCPSLTNVTIGDGVTSIGGAAFEFCTGLTSVIIPYSVTGIGEQAFYGCSSLTNVTIGHGVTSIGDGAFHACAGLAGVYFNGKPPGVGSSVFLGDSNATVYYLAGTPGWAATFDGLPTAPYDSAVGSLQVTIAPAGAITGGGRWQVDGGPLQGSGATVTNLAAGNHTVSFSTISGWTTPANQIALRQRRFNRHTRRHLCPADPLQLHDH